MIIIKLSGGLGNNMFQYVAVRSLAIKKNISFSYYKVQGIKYYYKNLIRLFRKIIFNKQDAFQKQVSNDDLSNYFILNHSNLKILVFRILWLLLNNSKKKYFHQKISPNQFIRNETHIDKSFFKISDNTKLSGPFSSERYFLVDRDLILSWFQPKQKVKKDLDKLISKITYTEGSRCCIHIRRGDALFMDKGYNLDGLGWGLPIDYYKYVIGLLPKNLIFIFVSDDPLWVEENFTFLKNKIIYRNNSEILDMLMFTKCKYNVIARSTFSWWGAWLNKVEDKVVYAPKNFIGLGTDVCFPLGLDLGKEVSNWKFVNLEAFKNN